ncbi:hypothetical protein DU508_09510 [Pedobacter chinensis]|uniref:Uncharacterized protein n=1 Tax=Pedobacter chinensis TaxID=2282421 RepID=A0A369Q1S1_9SPHI|nr:hypothetical protein DU508_09510 [Pedobacter chinensis]
MIKYSCIYLHRKINLFRKISLHCFYNLINHFKQTRFLRSCHFHQMRAINFIAFEHKLDEKKQNQKSKANQSNA